MKNPCRHSQARLQSQMGILNCSALSGPRGKAAGRIFSQFWPFLVPDLQVLFTFQRIWLQHHSQNARKPQRVTSFHTFPSKTYSCALFKFSRALFRCFHNNLQSWKERGRDIELVQGAWLCLWAGMEIVPLISSGEVESASHPFNLIFNSKWVPELHGFQWEMKRVSVSLLNEKESSPKSGH